MDILEPLDESNKSDLEEKIIITNIKSNSMDSDDEQTTVDHLAPQTLLETPDTDVQYSLGSPEGSMITYRVLQVQDAHDNSEFVSSSSSYPNSTAIPQVISGTNLNGPIYVIGNPDSYATTAGGTRPIAPRPTTIDTPVVVQVKKRDDRRRATHNEVERRRRDKINNWIAKLAKILPESPQDVKGNGQYDGHSKGGILAKAFEYIIELQATESRLGSCLRDNKKLAAAVEQLRTKNFALEAENTELKDLLQKHGIDIRSS